MATDNIGVTPHDPTRVPWDRVRLTRAFTPGRNHPVVGLVWHTLEGSTTGALDWWDGCMCGSAHFIVSRNGDIVLAVRLHDRAWHAGTNRATGRSEYWRNTDANEHTVGIELEGFANREPFPAAQLASCKRLAVWLTRQYTIVPEYRPNDIRGHKNHADVSNQRSDPGRHFPMDEVLAACRGAL